MGLDLLEFALAVEESFAIYLPDADAVRLTTPGILIDYLERRLTPSTTAQCLDQIAFYRVRRAAMRLLDKPRDAFRPDTSWTELIPEKHRRRHWQLLQQAVGIPRWPRLTLWGSFPASGNSVGATACYLATKCPSALKGASPTWSRREITEVVTRLMAEELGVTQFQMTDRFVQDLGFS
jgi:hypothetical protein